MPRLLPALVVRDSKPLVFIVDPRGLTLERGMQRVTSMGLDPTRARFWSAWPHQFPRPRKPAAGL